ncbi:MAG TPA: RNA ligase, partial [Bryobacteraceae bacterium]
LPLWIHNYSQRAQFEFTAENWPEALRDARGLVLDDEGRIVARGFRKFFNLSQLTRMPEGLPQFWEKADGSLILLFQYDGQRICSTRGSFDSEQALWAAKRMELDHPDFMPALGITYCLEAIYPGNRIVVDYGGIEELVLLAALDSETGADRDDALAAVAGQFRMARFYGEQEAGAIPGAEREGFVLRWRDGTRAKVKLDEYTRVHKLIYGTSTKTIWALLRAGDSPEQQAAILPSEMRQWIGNYADELRGQYAAVLEQQRRTYEERPDEARAGRPQFAEWAKRQKHPKFQFKLLDGKPIEDDVWRLIEPEFSRPEWAYEPVE